MRSISKIAEVVAISGSTVGAIAASVTQQVAYAIAPMTVALSLGAIKRHQLEVKLNQEKQANALQAKTLTTQVQAEVMAQVDKSLHDCEVSFEHIFARAAESMNAVHFGRKASRDLLIKAIVSANSKLLLVCPWPTKFALDSTVLHHLQEALRRGVTIEIGWGRLQDLESGKFRNSSFYDALPQLRQLARQHRNLRLKALGTHEKFLVCDVKFAAISSHNFLTSDDSSGEREVCLQTSDTSVINELIQNFELSDAIPLSRPKPVNPKNMIFLKQEIGASHQTG